MIVNDGIALKDNALTTHHGAVDEEATAMKKAGGVGEVLFEAVHEFAELLVEVQMRRLALAAGVEAQAEVLRELVGIGTHGEQVARRFHRGKADAGNLDGTRTCEALDGGTHRRFELDDGG